MGNVTWSGGVEHWTKMERWGKVVKDTGAKLE